MKKIALVAGSASTMGELCRQLSAYLGEEAEVAGYAVDEGISSRLEADILVLSSHMLRAELEAAGLIDPSIPTITARRTVNCDHLELVVALPPGTRALFVNDRAESAGECIASLRELGLDYIEYQPYYPGAPDPDPSIRVAITAGELGLVPAGIRQVIDIGVRILDFGTLAELLGHLGILDAKLGQFTQRYLATIVSVAQRLARSTEETGRINGHLAGVIDSLRHGILVYDGSGKVLFCNENLRTMLNLRVEDPAGRSLGAIIRNGSLRDFLECRCGEETAVFRVADRDIVVKRFEAGKEGQTVAAFRADRDAAAENARLAREYRKRGYIAKYDMDDIVGESEPIQRARMIALRLARTDLTILINGESGTGKELFASAIHAASGRSSGPFLAVDLGALSDDLIESELFGYEEGAFTGAKKGGKAGLFELADGGTIFLDEIGHISPKVQSRLLRVLQEKEVLRVGGSEIKRIDVRVIAASNEDLLESARRGGFREDLYFRLKMGLLRIPPLRERASDIPLLIEAFMRSEGQSGVEIASEVLIAFGDYDWPGNVRELRNLLTYMLAVRDGSRVSIADLPDEGFFEGLAPRLGAARAAMARPADQAPRLAAAPPLSAEDGFLLESVGRLEAEGRIAGRELLSSLAAQGGFDLSPARARGRIGRLARLGLLETGRGRHGTRLTPAGRELLGIRASDQLDPLPRQ
ncbi:MAG TPA: sigma 54-interacting transcriptional regulator [Rectinemataceae bacterium]|nr:sigma 54-interacting transcriptional regulator [Rectinemataceae bacterium]